MVEFLESCREAAPGVIVSTVISGFVAYYIRAYIDHKLKEEDVHRKKAQEMRSRRAQLEQKHRRALGRLLFWMYRGLKNPPPNGELEEAMREFQSVEDEQKELDQKILADYEIGGTA